MNWPITSPARSLSLMLGYLVVGDLVIKGSLVSSHRLSRGPIAGPWWDLDQCVHTAGADPQIGACLEIGACAGMHAYAGTKGEPMAGTTLPGCLFGQWASLVLLPPGAHTAACAHFTPAQASQRSALSLQVKFRWLRRQRFALYAQV